MHGTPAPQKKIASLSDGGTGLGIHGEAGVEQVIFDSARQAIDSVVGKLSPAVQDGPCVALLNNLGGASVLEMSVLLHDLIGSGLGSRITHVIGPAAMMTSLDMPRIFYLDLSSR